MRRSIILHSFPFTGLSKQGFRRHFLTTLGILLALSLALTPSILMAQSATPAIQSTSGDFDPYPVPPGPQGIWSATAIPGRVGEVHASGISFQFTNNYLMMTQVTSHLRNVPMVTYTGDGAVDSTSNYGGYDYNGVYSTGGMNTAPFGPGYAPATEGQPIYYNNGYPVYQNGILVNPQTSVDQPPVYRGQAEYGDPGTLIYSLWGGVVSGGGKVKNHAQSAAYKTEQFGGMIGLDLFCACDCRSGVFYGYQGTKLKDSVFNFNTSGITSGSLVTPASISGVGQEFQYRTSYYYPTNYNGTGSQNLKTQNHLIGLYHQFGSEFIYNIGTLRFGYNRVKSNQSLTGTGRTNGTVTYTMTEYVDGVEMGSEEITTPSSRTAQDTATMNGKYNEFLGGVSFERGANIRFLNMLTFTPRGAVDYTFLYRDKFDETINGRRTLHYKKGYYHSLRHDLGGNLALDLYPGNQHIKLFVKGSWIHEYLSYIYGKTTFTDWNGNTSTIKGNTTGRDWALIGGGAEWTIVPAFMIFGNYDYLRNKYVSSHYGDVGLKVMW